MDGGTGLVADIGRATVRFALSGGPPGPAPREVREFETAAHSTFTGALGAYLDAVGMRDASMASVLAISGVARDDVVNITGTRWFISLTGVETILRGPTRAINDFAANASALPLLAPSSFKTLPGSTAAQPIKPGGAHVAIGPGSGLGVAALLGDREGGWTALPSEAGHLSFAAATDAEHRFADHLAARSTGPRSAEMLLSGPGLLVAYAALGGKAAPTRPEEVTKLARTDPAARAALDFFTGYLASFAADMVLAFGAWDGVFLTGALARALAPQFGEPAFRRRFEDRGGFARRMRTVPVSVVTQSRLELLGAAALLHRP